MIPYKMFDQLETLIRQGQGAKAHEKLKKLKLGPLTAEEAIRLSQLCRRTSLYGMAFKKLKPFYFAARKNPKASEAIIAEYAALLTEVGSWIIAEKLFISIQPFKNEMTPYYWGLLEIKKWNYHSAYESFLHFSETTTDLYFRQFALINLTSCCIFLKKFSEAENIIKGLRTEESKLSGFANAILFELQGQLLFFTQGPSAAEAFFHRAQKEISSSKHALNLYIEKWTHICKILLKPEYLSSEALAQFKTQVENQGQWEILRELDRFEAIKNKDQKKLCKLYFGSPSINYKKFVETEFNWQSPDSFQYEIGNQSKGRVHFEVSTGFIKNSNHQKIKCSKLFLKIIHSLSLDLYKPITVGNLFEMIYNKEHFDPDHSTHKTYQVMARFQSWARKNKLALNPQVTPLGYKWGKQTELSLYFTKSQKSELFTDEISQMTLKIKQAFTDQKFSTEDFMTEFKVSRRTANRSLKILKEAQKISMGGRGRATKYRLI